MTATNMQTLKAQSRAVGGKSEARRVRRSGFVPAIAYGKDLASMPIAVAPKEVAAILKSELGKNTVIKLDLDGKNFLAMIREFTVHPVERSLEHVDFVEVKLDRPVDVDVPLIPIGKAVGVA
jgi:large subunit ribosomal protein L25